MSFINSIFGSSGMGAKLMFILSIVEFIKYLDINYSEEILLIFLTDNSFFIKFKIINE